MKDYSEMKAPPQPDSVRTVLPKAPTKATTVKSGKRTVRKGGRSGGR